MAQHKKNGGKGTRICQFGKRFYLWTLNIRMYSRWNDCKRCVNVILINIDVFFQRKQKTKIVFASIPLNRFGLAIFTSQFDLK